MCGTSSPKSDLLRERGNSWFLFPQITLEWEANLLPVYGLQVKSSVACGEYPAGGCSLKFVWEQKDVKVRVELIGLVMEEEVELGKRGWVGQRLWVGVQPCQGECCWGFPRGMKSSVSWIFFTPTWLQGNGKIRRESQLLSRRYWSSRYRQSPDTSPGKV